MNLRGNMIQVSLWRRSACLLILAMTLLASHASAQEIVVLGGVKQAQEWLQSEDWWGEENRNEQLTVPKTIITRINPS